MTSANKGTGIPSLDGLRCVAILPVFASHVLGAGGVTNLAPGNFGVTLFFFLSGYLITTLMRLELERTGQVSLKLFYLRRALRILPTCYLVLAVTGLYGWWSGTADPWWLLGQAAHLTNYQIIVGGWDAPIAPHTYVYWSLAVEEHFYIAFPLAFLFLARRLTRPSTAFALLCICAAVFLWRCWITFVLHDAPERTYLATDTRIDSILFGAALANWGNPAIDKSRLSDRMWKVFLFPCATLVILATFLGSRSFRETAGYSLQGVCLFAIFVTAVRFPEWGPMRFLNTATARWFGALSYAIYLTHPCMIAVSVAIVGQSLLWLVPTAAILTIIVSALIYYAIEVPVGRLRTRLSVLARLDRSGAR